MEVNGDSLAAEKESHELRLTRNELRARAHSRTPGGGQLLGQLQCLTRSYSVI